MDQVLRRELAKQEMRRLAKHSIASQMPIETALAVVDAVESFLSDPANFAVQTQREWAQAWSRSVRSAVATMDLSGAAVRGEYREGMGIEAGQLCALVYFSLWSMGVIASRNRTDAAAWIVRNEANGFAKWLGENDFPTLSEMLVESQDATNDVQCPPELWSAMVAGK